MKKCEKMNILQNHGKPLCTSGMFVTQACTVYQQETALGKVCINISLAPGLMAKNGDAVAWDSKVLPQKRFEQRIRKKQCESSFEQVSQLSGLLTSACRRQVYYYCFFSYSEKRIIDFENGKRIRFLMPSTNGFRMITEKVCPEISEKSHTERKAIKEYATLNLQL
jgi:hypothetical protein